LDDDALTCVCLKREHALGERPNQQRSNIILIGAMNLNGIVAALIFDGGIKEMCSLRSCTLSNLAGFSGTTRR
jgi:hypothetical protein